MVHPQNIYSIAILCLNHWGVEKKRYQTENFLFHTTSKQKKEEEVVLNLEQLERQAIEKALRISNGNISRAAEYLGITRFALYRKLEKLGL